MNPGQPITEGKVIVILALPQVAFLKLTNDRTEHLYLRGGGASFNVKSMNDCHSCFWSVLDL